MAVVKLLMLVACHFSKRFIDTPPLTVSLFPWKIDISGVQVEPDTQAGRDQQATSEFLTEELIRRRGNKSTILIMDEAHNLAPDIGQELLTSSQDAKQEAPFQLVLQRRIGAAGLLEVCQSGNQAQPSSFNAHAEFHIFTMPEIRSLSSRVSA